MGDTGGRDLKLNEAKFIDMGSLCRHSSFIVAAQEMRKDSSSLFG